ncbi:MAG: class I SAM-dependent methyltransferase [Magnetococcales bacterium]|nr:class I SAM-dependent methyltransferase [Magnetococcales bacterium]
MRQRSDALPKKVLNVGGNNKNIELPEHFDGFEHLLLDIDPTGNPDILCDARTLTELPAAQFDAVYCSHNLEHYHDHDVSKVLRGFMHVLKSDGFLHLRVPDMRELMKVVVERDLDLDDVLYRSHIGPVLVRDVIYGHAGQIERSGVDFFAHKTGFTADSLSRLLVQQGFAQIFIRTGRLEVEALAFKGEVSDLVAHLTGFSQVCTACGHYAPAKPLPIVPRPTAHIS